LKGEIFISSLFRKKEQIFDFPDPAYFQYPERK
jgi:hypothetical protein